MDYPFRPGPIRGVKTWRLEGRTLTTPDGEEVRLGEATAAGFAEMPTGRLWVTVFTLDTPRGRTGIQCNAPAGSDDRAACLSLCLDLCETLAACNPYLPVRRGPGGGLVRLIYAVMAAIPIGLGLYFLVLALTDSRGGGTGLAIGFASLFVGLGLFLLWCFRPWKPPPVDSPAAVAAQLRGRSGG